MVSPLDKNSGNIERDVTEILRSQTGAAPSGEMVAFTSRVAFGDIESGTLFPNYVARRGRRRLGDGGDLSPDRQRPDQEPTCPGIMGLSLDLSKAYVRRPRHRLRRRGHAERQLGPVHADRLGQAERYTLLSSPSPALSAGQRRCHECRPAASSTWPPRQTRATWSSTRSGASCSDAPADRDAAGDPNAVYEWVDGRLRLASVLPDGLTVPSATAGRIPRRRGRGLDAGTSRGITLISDDGRRVFFTAQVTSRSETGRVDGASTCGVREDGPQTPGSLPIAERPGDPARPHRRPRLLRRRRAPTGRWRSSRANAPLTEGARHRLPVSLGRERARGRAADRAIPDDGRPAGREGPRPSATTPRASTSSPGRRAGGRRDARRPNLYLGGMANGDRFIARSTPRSGPLDSG